MDGLTPIQAQLFALQDLGYRTFHCKLMPTVDPERVIGVRTPQIRQLAKQLSGTPEGEAFLKRIPFPGWRGSGNRKINIAVAGVQEYGQRRKESLICIGRGIDASDQASCRAHRDI